MGGLLSGFEDLASDGIPVIHNPLTVFFYSLSDIYAFHQIKCVFREILIYLGRDENYV